MKLTVTMAPSNLLAILLEYAYWNCRPVLWSEGTIFFCTIFQSLFLLLALYLYFISILFKYSYTFAQKFPSCSWIKSPPAHFICAPYLSYPLCTSISYFDKLFHQVVAGTFLKFVFGYGFMCGSSEFVLWPVVGPIFCSFMTGVLLFIRSIAIVLVFVLFFFLTLLPVKSCLDIFTALIVSLYFALLWNWCWYFAPLPALLDHQVSLF